MNQLFQQALEFYNSGRFMEAETALRKLISKDPSDVSGISLLSIVLLQSNKSLEEAESFGKLAIKLQPDNQDLTNNLGSVYWAQKRYDEALRCFEQVVKEVPEHVDAWHNIGNCHQSLGALKDAEEAFSKAFSINSKRADIANSYALLLFRTGRLADAAEIVRNSIKLQPEHSSSYGNLGLFLQTSGNYPEAIEAYNTGLKYNPRNADFYINLSDIHLKLNDEDKALAACTRAIGLNPRSSIAYHNLGTVLLKKEQIDHAKAAFKTAKNLNSKFANTYEEEYDLAINEFETALKLKPDLKTAMLNLANCHYKLGNNEASIKLYSKVIEFGKTGYISSAYNHRGMAKARVFGWQEAIKDFDQALLNMPDHANARYNRGTAYLKLGDFERGWRDYEWRFTANSTILSGTSHWRQPEWDGESFKGKTLLVHHEQGLGDAIHFIRYIPLLAKLGGTIVVRCGPPLFRLFESIPEISKMYSRKDNTSLDEIDYDMQVPLMSLPMKFNTNSDTIPDSVPYLKPPDALIEKWAERTKTNTFKIGLVWGGNPDQGDNNNRSCSLNDYAPLADIDGVTFYSLQVGEPADQIQRAPSGLDLIDFSTELTDMAETAALIKNLDLVITIDTSVAHLAGAIDHPVWVILWTNCCWRYLLDREDNPWYSSMRVFRQREQGNWSDPIGQVVDLLKQKIEQRNLLN